jgi:hypothetical protein
MNTSIQIRDDDVLQNTLWTKQGRKYLEPYREGGKTPFELFLEADKPFKKYNYPCILAILSEGIDVYPEWVEYIKKNQHRYIIELHGSRHYFYCDLTEERGERELRLARDKIEKTFGVKVSTWYVTFGRKKAPEWGQRVCDRMGIKYDIPNTKRDGDLWLKSYYYKEKQTSPFNHINFHFWHPSQRKEIAEVLKILCEESES